MIDAEIQILCEDIDRYHEERGGCPNHTAGESAIDAGHTFDGSYAREAWTGSIEQYPRPNVSRADAIAHLREAFRRQAEQLEDTEIAEMAR